MAAVGRWDGWDSRERGWVAEGTVGVAEGMVSAVERPVGTADGTVGIAAGSADASPAHSHRAADGVRVWLGVAPGYLKQADRAVCWVPDSHHGGNDRVGA